MRSLRIDGDHLTVEDVVKVAEGGLEVALHPRAEERVRRSRRGVDQLLEKNQVIYGVTTGFGNLADRSISSQEMKVLQRNLILSHATGVGPPLEAGVVRAMMLIRANTLAKGYSGVRPELVAALLSLLNRGVVPLVPCQGSVGASGDLAPLAHMSLVLIGEGEAFYGGEKLKGAEALRRADLEPIVVEVKEALSLTNGTSAMTALAALNVDAAQHLCWAADVAGALSLEALQGTIEPFDQRLHSVRPYKGQGECAKHLLWLLEGSELIRKKRDPLRIQDAYSLRCMPQVHGAVREALAHTRKVVETEMNSASDNPLVFWQGEPSILSGGNFHGEPIALAMDFLSMALSELGSISERRLARLLDDRLNGGLLPNFLTRKGGVNSGFMLLQYTAAALVSENKVLCHPASVDNIPVSANTEDHVSMGTIAARQTREIVRNVQNILAIELIAASQAIDFRQGHKGLKMGRGTGSAYRAIREVVPFVEEDTIMYPYIEAVRGLVAERGLAQRVGEGRIRP